MVYWFEQTAADVPPDDDWLSDRERSTLALLRIPKRREDWRLGRWTAKRAVAVHLGAGLRDVEVRAARSGAPRIFVNGSPEAMTLSLSHSNGIACCAVAAGAVALGCDIEKVEPRSAAFLSDYFTAEERSTIASWPTPLQDTAVTAFWCAKESVLKALEIGLRGDPLSVCVSVSRPLGAGWMPLHSGVAEGCWRSADGFVRAVMEFPDTSGPRVDRAGPPVICYQRVSFT